MLGQCSRAVKAQLTVWITINHSSTVTAVHLLLSFQMWVRMSASQLTEISVLRATELQADGLQSLWAKDLSSPQGSAIGSAVRFLGMQSIRVPQNLSEGAASPQQDAQSPASQVGLHPAPRSGTPGNNHPPSKGCLCLECFYHGADSTGGASTNLSR